MHFPITANKGDRLFWTQTPQIYINARACAGVRPLHACATHTACRENAPFENWRIEFEEAALRNPIPLSQAHNAPSSPILSPFRCPLPISYPVPCRRCLLQSWSCARHALNGGCRRRLQWVVQEELKGEIATQLRACSACLFAYHWANY